MMLRFASLMRQALAARGYTVLEAPDGAAAVARAATYLATIHLWVSDIVMPELNGPDAAQHIVGQRPEMRVLYVSGFASALAINFGTRGANASFLHNPFTAERLVKSVRACLDRDKISCRL